MPSRTTRGARAAQRFATIEKYFRSQLTQKNFCAQEGLTRPTFRYWLRKYKAPPHFPRDPRDGPKGFIPLALQPPAAAPAEPTQCVIEFPHGVIVRLSGPLDWQRLSQLIGR
jgi:hypothetical protein